MTQDTLSERLEHDTTSDRGIRYGIARGYEDSDKVSSAYAYLPEGHPWRGFNGDQLQKVLGDRARECYQEGWVALDTWGPGDFWPEAGDDRDQVELMAMLYDTKVTEFNDDIVLDMAKKLAEDIADAQ